jgi:dolichyl-phosphate-mannose--protein O-mannosyl transferase
MTNIQEAADVVTYFRGAFSLVFALALAEGFKQTVHDKADQATVPVLYKEKIFSLLSFLFLILPFYQGTMQFYGHYYADQKWQRLLCHAWFRSLIRSATRYRRWRFRVFDLHPMQRRINVLNRKKEGCPIQGRLGVTIMIGST